MTSHDDCYQKQQQRRGVLLSWGLLLLTVLLLVVSSSPANIYQIHALSIPTILPYSTTTRYHQVSSSSYKYSSSMTRHATTTTQQSPEEIQNEIIELREIATHRLEALLEQMEDLKRMNEIYEHQQNQVNEMIDTMVSIPDEIKVDLTKTTTKVDAIHTMTQPERIKDIPLPPLSMAPEVMPSSNTTTSSITTSTSTTTTTTTIPEHSSLNLLDDTTWKIVYNIGRERGTWMPKDWGVSGDRLLFQCTVQFTNESLSSSIQQYQDEFFHGSTNAKQLLVQDAFIIPRGVGDASVGRRPLPVQTIGAYKVCPNQGPYGTDIVRFYIELTDRVTLPDHTSDVYCPSGRIYATCGYFPIPSKHDPTKPSKRDMAQENYKDALREYEHIQAQLGADTRGFFNMDHFQLLQESWKSKQRMDEMALKLREAKQQEPEKSQLRLNMDQSIGLTHEGGVCCKVQKGLALEYHILGKIEVGCMNNH